MCRACGIAVFVKRLSATGFRVGRFCAGPGFRIVRFRGSGIGGFAVRGDKGETMSDWSIEKKELKRVRDILGPDFDYIDDPLLLSDLRYYSVDVVVTRHRRSHAGRERLGKVERHRIIDIIIAEVQPLLPDQAGYAPAMARDVAEKCTAKILFDKT
jgi:hypothetical protein